MLACCDAAYPVAPSADPYDHQYDAGVVGAGAEAGRLVTRTVTIPQIPPGAAIRAIKD